MIMIPILKIRDDIAIDFRRIMNASCLYAGRTRSGKTSAIVAVHLLPILLRGPDNYGSRVTIIDPKSAELSQCAGVISPGLHGEVDEMYSALDEFEKCRVARQQMLNQIEAERHQQLHWYDVGMMPSILFIDEYVTFLGLFPVKGSKEHPEHNVKTVQKLIRRIATQGASAGCFLIISIAEASVGTGGLEAVVNHACGIRVLMRPDREEAKFLWDSDRVNAMPEYTYGPGDAWITIDDGIHDRLQFVRYPWLQFDFYGALSQMLDGYQAKSNTNHP
jgi:hypothetical protein